MVVDELVEVVHNWRSRPVVVAVLLQGDVVLYCHRPCPRSFVFSWAKSKKCFGCESSNQGGGLFLMSGRDVSAVCWLHSCPAVSCYFNTV